METETAIKVGMATTKIKSVQELSQRTGIKGPTLYKRMKHPGTMTLSELRQIAKTINMSDELLLAAVKG